MTRTAAVVLAAGCSRRMGRPKQLLPFRGRSLLRHAVGTALETPARPVVVVLGAGAGRLAAELAGLPVLVAENPAWDLGPGTSVRAAVAAVERLADPVDAVLLMACDQPFVTAAHLLRLLEARAEAGLPMAASEYEGGPGVPAVFARECFSALSALDPTSGAKPLLARRPEMVARVPFPAAAIDLDTPEDYERWAATPPGVSTEEPHADA